MEKVNKIVTSKNVNGKNINITVTYNKPSDIALKNFAREMMELYNKKTLLK